jgi:negative regulator of flagellin synthesis FlgM
MKIDDKMLNHEIGKHLPKSTPNATEKVGEKQVTDEQKTDRSDRSAQDTVVNLSQASKEAQHIEEIVASEPDVREDKVAELKEKIETGKYEMDNEAVADKLVDAFVDEAF